MLTPFNILAHKLFKDVYQPNFKTDLFYPFICSYRFQSRAQTLVAGGTTYGVGVTQKKFYLTALNNGEVNLYSLGDDEMEWYSLTKLLRVGYSSNRCRRVSCSEVVLTIGT